MITPFSGILISGKEISASQAPALTNAMKKQKKFSGVFHAIALLALMSGTSSFAEGLGSSDVVADSNTKALAQPQAISEQKSNVSEITKSQTKFEQVREPRI